MIPFDLGNRTGSLPGDKLADQPAGGRIEAYFYDGAFGR